MPYDFCTRLTVKIRRLGYPRRNAERLARFLVPRVVLISARLDVHIVPVNTVQKLIARKGNPAAELFDDRTSGCGQYFLIDTGPDEFVVDRFREGTGRPLAKPWNNSDIPGLWSGTGEVIMVEERGLSLVGIAEEQNTTEMIGND